jgi:PAS domain S-box-containing protein
MEGAFRSGDALFAFDADLRVLSWNEEAERLTGIAADEVVGSTCWEALGAVDESGAVVCHPGCSGARLAREGWPVPCRKLLIRTREGRRPVTVSTIAVRHENAEPVILHLLRNGDPVDGSPRRPVELTARQRQVLRLLADGVPAKLIAQRLGIAEVTARNHIQGLLRELRCHSQLAAVAEARRLGLV